MIVGSHWPMALQFLEVLPIEDEFCSHVLVDQSRGARVRAIEASKDWPIEKLRKSLGRG